MTDRPDKPQDDKLHTPVTKDRRKSEKRQREKITPIRWAMHEFNDAAGFANNAGMSFGAYARACMLKQSDPGPRSRRRLPVKDQALVKALALLGRYGNNMNQIAHQLNAHGEDALSSDFRRALKEWAEIRDAMYEALGREPSGSTPSGHTPA